MTHALADRGGNTSIVMGGLFDLVITPGQKSVADCWVSLMHKQ